MSTGAPSPLRPRQWLSPSVHLLMVTWLTVLVAGYVLFNLSKGWFTGTVGDRIQQRAQSQDPPSASPEPRLAEPADTTDSVDRSSNHPSALAVQRMKLAEHKVQIQAARKQLGRLRQLHAEWEDKQELLLTGDVGKRIAGDATQLGVIADLLDESRADATSLDTWELQLKELATPVEQALADSNAGLELSAEHQQLLSHLGEQIEASLKQADRAALVLRGVENATAKLTPVDRALRDVLSDRQAEHERSAAERQAAAKDTARLAAEKEQAEKIAKLERELAEAKSRVKEAELKAEAERVENLARLEQERQAEEARLEVAKRQAEINSARDAADSLKSQKEREQRLREFERDLPKVLSYLRAFTEDGFKHRPDKTKGPASFSYLQGEGVLKDGIPGLQRLLFLGSADNDRPRGALPEYIGGNIQGVQGLNIEPVEKAQALLRKYGELMVERKLLAP